MKIFNAFLAMITFYIVQTYFLYCIWNTTMFVYTVTNVPNTLKLQI